MLNGQQGKGTNYGKSNAKCASHNVPKQCRDHALPDVISNRDVRAIQVDRHGHKEHIRDNVVESQAHEGKRWPPDRHDLAKEFPGFEREETCQTDEPVGADAAEEDHMPLRTHDLLVVEREYFILVWFEIEDAALTAHVKLVRLSIRDPTGA